MPITKPKKRYAFADVQNTASTTRKLLGFLDEDPKRGIKYKPPRSVTVCE